MTTVLELAKRLRTVEKKLSTPKPSVALHFAAEVDRLYRLREGTAHTAAAGGTVRSVKRRGPALPGFKNSTPSFSDTAGLCE